MSKLAPRWTALAMPLWMLTAGCLPHSLESTEAGVRTVRLAAFGSTGVVPEPYAPGQTYFFIPIINGWTVFDVGLQNLAMTTSRDSGAREGDDSLRFKTADGNDISVDVTIAWRLDPSKRINGK